jgi:rhodanese-related sulfurtransferase
LLWQLPWQRQASKHQIFDSYIKAASCPVARGSFFNCLPMTKFYIAFAILTVVLLAIVQISKAQSKSHGRIDLTSAEFAGYLQNHAGVTLLDVRTPEEFASGHLKGAVNIPVNAVDFAARVAGLKKDEPVLVYCRSGHRSLAASDQLGKLGFLSVVNLAKGILGWMSDGYSVEK